MMPAFRVSGWQIVTLIVGCTAVIAISAVALILGKDAIIAMAAVLFFSIVLVSWLLYL